jgi:hypothetical protein
MSATTSKLFLTCLILLSFPAAAQVHKWVDDKGRVHYGDQPPNGRTSETLAIPTRGAEFPPTDGTCQSVRCQYERMRADRLREEEDRRRELIAGYDLQQRSAQSWNNLYATLAERDRIQQAEWDAFRFGPTPMDVRLQRDRVFSRAPVYGGVIVNQRPALGGNRPQPAPAGSRLHPGNGGR